MSKPHPSVASVYVQMAHFELWSDFTGHFFDKLN